VPTLSAHLYRWEGPLGKTYGIERRCYWEQPWGTPKEPKEHIENIIETHWELERNMLRTKTKWKKPSTHPRLAFRHQDFPQQYLFTKASNNFSKSFTQKPILLLQHFLNISSCTKQTTQNKVATPTLYSSLLIPPLGEWTISFYMDRQGEGWEGWRVGVGCNFVLDNCYACCALFFFLSLPQKNILILPLSPQRKKGEDPIVAHPLAGWNFYS